MSSSRSGGAGVSSKPSRTSSAVRSRTCSYAARTARSRAGVSGSSGQTWGVAKRIAVPWLAALSQSMTPSSTLCAPSSPEGTTCEWMSTKKDTAPTVAFGYPRGRTPLKGVRVAHTGCGLFGLEVELEVRRDEPELAQRARLELAHALARDPEARTDLLERLRLVPVEPEPQREDRAHARVQRVERRDELAMTHRG